MIAGPAVLTTLLTLAQTHGYPMTLIAFTLNLTVVWAALRWASQIGRVLGDAGCRAITKVLAPPRASQAPRYG
jgi:small neutral amino acid transporter SnatA (MarC family)